MIAGQEKMVLFIKQRNQAKIGMDYLSRFFHFQFFDVRLSILSDEV